MVGVSVCISRALRVVLCLRCSMLLCYVVFACLAMRPDSCGLIFRGCVASLFEQCVVVDCAVFLDVVVVVCLRNMLCGRLLSLFSVVVLVNVFEQGFV